MIYLLAYPRSGSSFFRYCLGYLTESKPMQPQGHCELDHLLEQYYKKEPFIKKFHKPKEVLNITINQIKGNKLALLYRDPIENITSYALSNENLKQKDFSEDFIDDFINHKLVNDSYTFNKYLNNYIENIKFYRNWTFEKTLISYENLMLNPKDEFLKHMNFFGYDEERVNEFMNNFDFHKNLVLKEKTKSVDPFSVNTKGKDNNKFKNILTEENLLKIQKRLSPYVENLQPIEVS